MLWKRSLVYLACSYAYCFIGCKTREFDIRSDLESVLVSMLDNIFSECGSTSHKEVVDVFLNAASFSKSDEGCSEKSMSFGDFITWCSLLPSARKFLGSLLAPPDPGFLFLFSCLYAFSCCPVQFIVHCFNIACEIKFSGNYIK